METVETVEETGVAVPADAAAAVAALDDLEQAEQQQVDQPTPEEIERARELEAARLDGARMAAGGIVGGLVVLLESQLPYVELPDDKRQELADKLAPVLAKSGGGMPEWLVPYKEELEFGMCLAGVGFGVLMQVKQHKKAAKLAQQQPRQNQGDAGQAAGLTPITGDPLDPSAED